MVTTGEQVEVTDSGVEFKDVVLPFAEKVKETAINLHRRVPFFRLISWDLAVNPSEEVILIEYNMKGQDINLHQLNSGPVLSPLLEELKP